MEETLNFNATFMVNKDFEIDHNVFSPRLRVEIENILRSGPHNFLILDNFSLDYANILANLLNRNWANSPRSEDILISYPVEDRWSIESIKSEIISKSILAPYNRNYIIIANTDSISSSGFDKLLKTLEEPVSPTTFILITSSAQVLPKTILSRAQFTLEFKEDDEIFYYQNLDLADQSLVRKIQDIAGANLGLGKLLLENSEVLTLANEVFSDKNWERNKRIPEILELEGKLSQLASSWQVGKLSANQKLATPAERLKARILLGIGLKIYLRNFEKKLGKLSSSLSGRYSHDLSGESFLTLNQSLLNVEKIKKYNVYNVNLRNTLIALLLSK